MKKQSYPAIKRSLKKTMGKMQSGKMSIAKMLNGTAAKPGNQARRQMIKRKKRA